MYHLVLCSTALCVKQKYWFKNEHTSGNGDLSGITADERNWSSGHSTEVDGSRDYMTKQNFLQLLRVSDEIVQGSGRKCAECSVSWSKQSEWSGCANQNYQWISLSVWSNWISLNTCVESWDQVSDFRRCHEGGEPAVTGKDTNDAALVFRDENFSDSVNDAVASRNGSRSNRHSVNSDILSNTLKWNVIKFKYEKNANYHLPEQIWDRKGLRVIFLQLKWSESLRFE